MKSKYRDPIKYLSDYEWLDIVKENMHLSEKDKLKLIMGEEPDGLLKRRRNKDMG